MNTEYEINLMQIVQLECELLKILLCIFVKLSFRKLQNIQIKFTIETSSVNFL